MKKILVLATLLTMFINATTLKVNSNGAIYNSVVLSTISNAENRVVKAWLRDNVTGKTCYVRYNKRSGSILFKRFPAECDSGKGVTYVGGVSVRDDMIKDRISDVIYRTNYMRVVQSNRYTAKEKWRIFEKIRVYVCADTYVYGDRKYDNIIHTLKRLDMYEESRNIQLMDYLTNKSLRQYCGN